MKLHHGSHQRARCAGFSLLELFFVAIILVVVTTLYYGGGSRSAQQRRIASCGRNLEYIFVALKTYSVDNNGAYPFLTNAQTSEPVLSLLVPKCTTRTEFFICPGSDDKELPEAEPFASRRISYAYYMGRTSADGADAALISDRQVNTNSKTAGQQVFSGDGKKPGNNHNKYGGNVMFCDGTVRVTAPYAAFDLTNGANVVLLNPNP